MMLGGRRVLISEGVAKLMEGKAESVERSLLFLGKTVCRLSGGGQRQDWKERLIPVLLPESWSFLKVEPHLHCLVS